MKPLEAARLQKVFTSLLSLGNAVSKEKKRTLPISSSQEIKSPQQIWLIRVCLCVCVYVSVLVSNQKKGFSDLPPVSRSSKVLLRSCKCLQLGILHNITDQTGRKGEDAIDTKDIFFIAFHV